MRTFILVSLVLLSACNSNEPAPTLQAPPTAKQAKIFEEFGNKRTDDYFWLNDPKNPAVIRHLEAENAYVDTVMGHTSKLQKKLYDELVGRLEQTFQSLPVLENGYWYYARFEEGRQYPLYCRKKENLSAPEEVYLDVNSLAKDHALYIVTGREFSPDNQWLAFGEDTSGDRRSTLYFRNQKGKNGVAETIPNTSGDYAWANDNKTLYYLVNDHTVRSYRLMRHTLGTDPKNDQELYTEKDSTFSLNLYKTSDKKRIVLFSNSTTSTEARHIDVANPVATPVLIQARQKDLIYRPNAFEGNVFYIYHNKDAKNFKLSTAPIDAPTLANWKDVIPASDSALLQEYEVLKDYIVAQQKINGLSQIKVIDRKNNASYYIDFGEQSYVAEMELATDLFDTDSIRFSYSSLTTPSSNFKYDLDTKSKTLLKQVKVGGGYDAALYETKRVWATAKDGVKVPLSIVYRKERMKKDGSNPLFLYAYGSYGYSTDPYFQSSVISLLDRGFAFAIAHIRGGQELGRAWYEDGKLLHKKNTFTDFVDCAEFLIQEKYTASDKIFANGGSAGGMLMGAVINLRPDLFKGVIAEVPWMDVITDMLNSDLPLTTLEYEEWGDPHKKEYYDYMLSWSPYDNIKKTAYPAILATGGLNDTQVPYFSPAKWVARVRENNTGNQPILFKCNMGAGHGGASGRFERQKLTALKYAFMIDQLGMKE